MVIYLSKSYVYRVLLLSILLISFVKAENQSEQIMVVQADIIANEENNKIISIEVPDELFLGEIKGGRKSEEVKITINNTGNVNISVRPELKSGNRIFENLYFRKRKTGEQSAIYQIGEFELFIPKPPSYPGKKSEYCYIFLDLTNEDILRDMINEKAEIKFIATSAE